MTYGYDTFDRRVKKSVDDDGNGTIDRTERYVYDFTNKTDGTTDVSLDDVVLTFDGSGALTHRYLHGADIDELFADETATGAVLWALDDGQGTIRDWAEYNSGTNTTTVTDHLKYDSYGRITSQSNSAHTVVYAFTGREWDKDVDLQYNRMRWYDPVVGRWISEDPIGFAGGDANLVRYVGNNPTNWEDPSGCAPPSSDNIDERILPNDPTELVGLNWWWQTRQQILDSVNAKRLLKSQIPVIPDNLQEMMEIHRAGAGKEYSGLLKPGQYIGPSGCGPCIGVLLIPIDKDLARSTVALHISRGQLAGASISGCGAQFQGRFVGGHAPAPTSGIVVYDEVYRVVIVGAAMGGEGQLCQVISQLYAYGVRDFTYVNAQNIFADEDGNLFFPDEASRSKCPDDKPPPPY